MNDTLTPQNDAIRNMNMSELIIQQQTALNDSSHQPQLLNRSGYPQNSSTQDIDQSSAPDTFTTVLNKNNHKMQLSSISSKHSSRGSSMHRRRKSSHGGRLSNATKRDNSFVHQDIHIIDDLCSSYTGNNNLTRNSQESILVLNTRNQESQMSMQPSNYFQQYMDIQENHALQVAIQEVHEKEDQPERESMIRDQSTCQEGESALREGESGLKSTSRLTRNNSKSKSTSVKKFKAKQSVLSTIERGGRSPSPNSRSSVRSNKKSGGRSQRAAHEADLEDSLQNPMIVNITGKSVSVV